MKRLLIAVAALSLTSAGAVFAQANPPSPSNSDQSSTMPPSTMAPTPTTASPSSTTGGTANSATMSPGTMPTDTAAPASSINTGSTMMVGDQTTANPAPSSYQRCTHKGQDRCKTKGG